MIKFGIVNSKDLEQNNLTAEHYLNKKIRCSLCPQEFPKFDEDIDARKKAHEARHRRGKQFKGQSSGGGNNIVGKVEWLDV